MTLQLTGALRRSVLMVGRARRCGGAGGGVCLARRCLRRRAGHDTWQVGISGNCNNPSFCGPNDLGGFWGWVEFDRFANGTITGDAQLTGCHHFTGGGGSGGAGHADVDITSAHIVPAGPDDPNPGGQVFFIDHNVVNGVTDDPDFLGDRASRSSPATTPTIRRRAWPSTSRSPSGPPSSNSPIR